MSSKQSDSSEFLSDIDSTNRVPSSEGTLSFASPEANPDDADILVRGVGTARSDWLPTLLRKSLPWLYEAAERVASKFYPQGLDNNRDGPVSIYLQDHGVSGLRGTYSLAAAQLATYTDRETVEEAVTPPVPSSNRLYRIIRTLTQIGYSKDPYKSTIDDLGSGPASLVALCEVNPTVYLHLESDSWAKNRRRLREDTLDAIARLKQGYHVKLVASTTVERTIRTRHPNWCDEYLTQDGPSSNLQKPSVADNDDPLASGIDSELWTTLSEMAPGGRFELIDAIPAKRAQRRTVESLKGDSSLDFAAGTIDRYYRDLEQNGLVSVVEPNGSNEVYLTPEGRVAQNLLTEDCELQHPLQRNLTDDTSTPSQPQTSIVCGGDGRDTRLAGDSFEEALRANEGGNRGPKTRQLPLSNCRLDERSQFNRLAAYRIAEGVTLVDERICELEDGRGTFFGAQDSECHAVVQWGGALPTLVRSAVTLLSDLAFNHVLTPENLSSTLSGSNALDQLRRRMQVGWVSTTNHSQLRGDLQKRAHSLLGKVGSAKKDQEVWDQTAREALGLITSATALFDAAGHDVTVHIRIPDTAQLTRDDDRYREFLDFMRATTTKSYQYKGHSAHRLLLETDGDKLSYRFSDIVDTDDQIAQATASWVIVGPEATDFREDLAETIAATPVREQVAEGDEIGIRIPVELASTDSASVMQSSIDSLIDRIDHSISDEIDTETLFRHFMHAFYNTDGDRFPSPGDIAETLTIAEELTSGSQPIGDESIVRGLGYVGSERLYPWLAPSARSIMSALLRSEEPLQRKDILENASISESSYYRHRSRLEELGLVVDVGGHRYEPVAPGEWAMEKCELENHGECDDFQTLVRLTRIAEGAIFAASGFPDGGETVYIN